MGLEVITIDKLVWKEKIVFSSKFLNMVKTEYQDNNGETKHWLHCTRPNKASAVMIVPIVEFSGKHFLGMIKEYRIPIKDYEWGFPAGLINEGETAEQAVRRELEEETGLKVKRILSIGKPVFSTSGITDEAIQIAFVQCEKEIGEQKLGASEDIKLELVDRELARKLAQSEDKSMGAKAWTILHMMHFFSSMQWEDLK